MKQISKESVEDISNYITQLLEQKIGALESKSQIQNQSLRTVKEDCKKIEQALTTLDLPEENKSFQIYESLAVELKSYLRSKTNGSVLGDESLRNPSKVLDQNNEEKSKDFLLEQFLNTEKEGENGSNVQKKEVDTQGLHSSRINRTDKISPSKEAKQNSISKQNSSAEKNTIGSPKAGVSSSKGSNLKKV